MKTKIFLALSLSMAMLTFGQDWSGISVPANAGTGKTWQLQSNLSDDFNYNGKSNSKFTSTWVDYYTPDVGWTGPGETNWVQGNSKVINGKLEILGTPGPNGKVNCGVISSKTKLKYPIYMEARIKASNLENSSNFWLLSQRETQNNNPWQEIDILEVYGGSPDDFFSKRMSTNFHMWKGTQDNTYQVFNTAPGNGRWRDQYHRFGCYWKSPTDITFYIDGVPTTNGSHFVTGREKHNLNGSYNQAILQNPVPSVPSTPLDKNLIENQFTKELFLIIDTESHHGKPVSPVADLNNSAKNKMLVDWVRIYKPVSSNGNTSTSPIGSTIWLKANNGSSGYVSARRNVTDAPMRATGTYIGGWERFIVEDAGDGRIALKANANGKYVQTRIGQTNTPLQARGTYIGNWEKFIWENQGAGKVALKSNHNGKYIQAGLHLGDRPLTANASIVRGWETFNWGIVAGSKNAVDNSVDNLVAIYPNPATANSLVTITGGVIENSISIYNNTGQLVKVLKTTSENQEVSLGGLTRGLYFVSIGISKNIKLIIK